MAIKKTDAIGELVGRVFQPLSLASLFSLPHGYPMQRQAEHTGKR